MSHNTVQLTFSYKNSSPNLNIKFESLYTLPVRPVYVEIVCLGSEVGQPLPRREDDALDGLPVGIAPEESLRGAAAAHRQPVRPPWACKIFQDHSNLNFI